MVKGRKSSEIPYEKLMAVRKRRAFEVDETRLKRLRKAATNVIQKQLVDLKLKEIEQYKDVENSSFFTRILNNHEIVLSCGESVVWSH